jgi:hypothetical protein
MTALEEIKKALAAAEQFIVNGVELGYIRMPAPETPDSAHQTLPMIRQAQTALESLQRENEELRQDRDRTARNRDMYKGQVERQAAQIEDFRSEAKRLQVGVYVETLPPVQLIRVFADDMNERNWKDKRAYIKQQADRISTALASREGDTHKPVAYVCAADMELLGKSSDGWDFSMSPKPRPDLGMNMALYAAPLTETSKPDPVLWVSPVDLRAWQKAKAGEIWAWSENLEGECIPLYTALASTGGEHHAE